VVDGALDVIVNGPVSSTKTSKNFVGKVTNTGTSTLTVCDDDIVWTVSPGSVTGTGACADLAPGASKRFKFTWTYGAGGLTSGQSVTITGDLNVDGDVNQGNDTDSATRTVK